MEGWMEEIRKPKTNKPHEHNVLSLTQTKTIATSKFKKASTERAYVTYLSRTRSCVTCYCSRNHGIPCGEGGLSGWGWGWEGGVKHLAPFDQPRRNKRLCSESVFPT